MQDGKTVAEGVEKGALQQREQHMSRPFRRQWDVVGPVWNAKSGHVSKIET